MAGLWDRWKDPETGQMIFSFTVITQGPNELMTDIHDRMPAILTPEQEKLWLADDVSPKELIDMITPYDSEKMEAYPVSKKVGNVRNNDAELIKKARPEIKGEQMDLF